MVEGTELAPVESERELSENKDFEEEIFAEDFEAAEEGRAPKVLAAPPVPSRQEVEEHEITHFPFRSWCPDCVRGRAAAPPHRRAHVYNREQGVPMVVGDYCYMTGQDRHSEDAASKPTILVMREVRSGATMSMVVPGKGDTVKWVVDRCVNFIDDIGFQKVILRSDQEPSIASLFRAVRAARGEAGQTIL